MKPVVNVVVSVLILATGVAGLRFFGQKPVVSTQDADDGDAAAMVVTAAVTQWQGPFFLATDGEAVTYRVITVGAEVEGRIVHKSDTARGGNFVQKGDVLFEIDPVNYQLEVDRLNAELLQAEEEIKAVAVDLKNAEALIALAEEDWQLQQNQLQRMQSLLKRKTANASEVEAAMKLELTARNALQTLRNQVLALAQQQKTRQATEKLIGAQLRRAEADVRRCLVKSPLEGRIVDDSVEEGDYAKSGDVLVRISDGSRMEVKCQLRGEELAWIWLQQPRSEPSANPQARPEASFDPVNLPQVPCEVAFTMEGVETLWDGYISRLEGTGLDRDTRTFPCRILVEEPRRTRVNNSAGGRATVSPPTLVSGMYVTVRIPVESPVPLLQVPIEAVRPGGQVWVWQAGRLQIRDVSVAHTQPERVLVRADSSGLQDGDRVVVSPLASVQNGMLLQEAKESTE